MKCRHSNNSRAGHTLVETAVACVVAVMMIGAVGLITVRANAAYRASTNNADANTHVQRAIERVAKEFMDADRSSLALTPTAPQPASAVDFRRGTGYAAGVLTVGATRRIRFEYATGEVNNDRDDNGNGLIDEGRIVLRPDLVTLPNTTVMLVDNVRELLEGEIPNGQDDNGNGLSDEPGFTMTYDTTSCTLTLRATVESPGEDGALITRTSQTSIWIRND